MDCRTYDERTAAQWYAADVTCDIRAPDGWRDPSLSAAAVRAQWMSIPITRNEYERRRDLCTIAPLYHYQHRDPFPAPLDDD